MPHKLKYIKSVLENNPLREDIEGLRDLQCHFDYLKRLEKSRIALKQSIEVYTFLGHDNTCPKVENSIARLFKIKTKIIRTLEKIEREVERLSGKEGDITGDVMTGDPFRFMKKFKK